MGHQMTKRIEIDPNEITPRRACEELEAGNILYLPKCPFGCNEEERALLLAQRQTQAAHRKNIAYKPQTNRITNFVPTTPQEAAQLLAVMQGYSQRIVAFLSQLLAPYAGRWRVDYASFRPFEEMGRQLRTRARNDLVHTDAFPSRPMNGSRILRFFTNLNPTESRNWITSMPFQELVKRYGGDGGVPLPRGIEEGQLRRSLERFAKRLGLPVVVRSPYDRFMLRFHNFLKENADFQANGSKCHWAFPPNSCWIVYTDQVSHAVTGGKFALEQTLIVPRSALVQPEWAPVSVLERLSGRTIVFS